jgi:hypothetical protein
MAPRTLGDLVLIASVDLLTLSAPLGPLATVAIAFFCCFGFIAESYGTLAAVSAPI